jgi:hypothetical protein
MAAKWAGWGESLSGTTARPEWTTITNYGTGSPQGLFGTGTSQTAQPKGWFSTTDTPGLLQLKFAQNASNSTPTVLQQGSWLRITELGPSSGTTTYVTVYTCTGSRSYDSHGNYIGAPDGDNNMYLGNLAGRSFGNEQHMWTFNGAQIRSDLAGATILSAQMYLYAFQCGSSKGGYDWTWSTTSTIQTTMPTNGFGGSDNQNVWTTIPGWAGFDITTSITAILASNANSVLGGPAVWFDSNTAFRGYGTAGYQPFMQVTYAR